VVGRERELEVVRAFLGGGVGALVLEGEAGIGKTTVWHAGVEVARERGVRVLVARPAEAETALPYATLSDLLEPVRDDALRSMPAPQRRALDVALVRKEGEVLADARAVAAAALTALRTLSEDRWVLVAIDDVQWVDDASAGAISYAIRRLSLGGVSMLATERIGVGGGLQIAEVERVSIDRLGTDQIARIVRGRLGFEVRRSGVLRLAERSGGNPFFALELARDGRLLDDPDAPLPPSLDVLLRERVAALARAVRDALLVAAAHPAPTSELLARAGIAPTAVEGALDLGLLVQAEDRLRFSHPLIASAVLARTTPGRRREVHARLAAVLEDPDERALHLARATVDPDEDIAARLEEAAERIRGRGAARDAVELAAQAVRLTPSQLPDAARRRAVAHASLVGASGDGPQAYVLLKRLAEEAPHGPERARVLLTLSDWATHEPSEIIRVGEDALAQCGEAERPKALLALAGARWSIGEFGAAARLIDEAVPLAEASGDDRTLASALFDRGWMQWSRGGGVPEEFLLRASALLPPTELRPILDTHPERLLATILHTVAEYERARPLLEKHLQLAREHGDDRIVSEVLAELGSIEARVGHASRAEELVAAAVELAQQLQEPQVVGWALYWRARVRSLLGRLDAARADAEETIAMGFELYRIMAVDVLGYVALTLGQLDTAADHLQHVLDRVGEYPFREPSPVDAHQHLAEVFALRGEPEQAEAVLDELETVAGPLDRTRSLAGALRVRGLIAAKRGDVDRGEELLRESLRVQERRPEPHESGRTLLVLGSMLRGANRKRDARDALEEAVSKLERCGSRVWADRARSELDRISGRPLRTGSMTATEDQIAHLVAAGKSNHEVAQALSLSPKTIEWNLSKIYRKLGVRSRTELAAKVARSRAV
jgi:DNA-binding CsgD family transcriptional regulator